VSGEVPAEPPLLVLLGPTGTGKTDLALGIAAALDTEIVGCDALQVYRGFDAATAKPGLRARAAVPHHLVDCVDPATDFTLGDYVRLADRAIASIRARGRVPLIVGGTGLYLRGLLRGVIEAPARDPRLRDRLRRTVERGGGARLHAWLALRDPAAAARIGPADAQRLVRAVELARSEGGTWTERLEREGTWKGGTERYRAVKVGLDGDRERLARALDARVDAFFAAGLVREVRELLDRGVPPGANAFKAIAYREVLAAILRGDDPESVRPEVQRSTRRYAKRQRSWYRGEAGVVWLDAGLTMEDLARRAIREWRRAGP
jgi:tRNA dimethylallyltransferase